MPSAYLLAAMPTSAWTAFTSLGGAGLMLPIAAAIAVQLIAARAWQSALWWSTSIAAAVGLVLMSKIAFLGWGIGIRALDFTGISGHATLAASVIPVLAYLVLPRKRGGVPVRGILCGVALSAVVGLSRFVLGAHSPAEIVAGFGLGALVVGAFIRLAERREKPVIHVAVTAALLLLTTLFHYGRENQHNQTTAHDVVVKMALYASGRDRPYSRAEWQRANSDPRKY